MGRLLGRIIVGLTVGLISFIAYSSQIFIIWPWYGHELSVELITLLLPFNILVGLLLWNYFLCVITDPGGVPETWEPDIRSQEGYEVKKLTGGPRYCRTCESYKPPRAHHCRQCDRCILRMDHHCPWVNNCVGHFNYGHFIRFLFYVDVACSYHLAMVTRRVFGVAGTRYWDEPSSIEMIFIILNYATSGPVLLAVGAFSLYHFHALLGNTTTIEGWEKDKAATLVRRGKIQEVKFPYNLGAKRNIESVLGPNPLMWCWPTVPPGTGLKYELAAADGKHVELHSMPTQNGGDGLWNSGDDSDQFWPPLDPTDYYRCDLPEPDPDYELTLPSSPWTYENGSLNPSLRLRPSSSSGSIHRGRGSAVKSVKRGAAVPPYHPDYHSSAPKYLSSSDEDSYGSDEEQEPLPRIRRGSEGYEVRPIDREAILQEHVRGVTARPGRYQQYVPNPSSDSETDDELEDEPFVAVDQRQHVGIMD